MPQEKATSIDALIDKMTDQALMKTIGRSDAFAEQYATGFQVVSLAMSQMYSMGVQIVNATALNRIPSGTANQVLEHNATGGQPFNAPPAPRPPGT